MDIVTRQKLIVLIQLAKADHNFAPEEREFINNVAEKHDFSKAELEVLLESNESIETLGALSNVKKKEYLIDSFGLIMADGVIEPQEIIFCQNIAVKLGYHKDIVPAVLNNWESLNSIDFSTWKLV